MEAGRKRANGGREGYRERGEEIRSRGRGRLREREKEKERMMEKEME